MDLRKSWFFDFLISPAGVQSSMTMQLTFLETGVQASSAMMPLP